jgi:flagellar biosynthesis chaperone FliJ
MTKLEQVTKERISTLNEWLEKTKDITSPATRANAENVKVVLRDFKNLNEIVPVLIHNPSFEVASEINNLMSKTIDELISHNRNILINYKKMIDSLEGEINKSVAPLEETQKTIDSYRELYVNLEEQVKLYQEAKQEVDVLVEKAVSNNKPSDDLPPGVELENGDDFPL